MRGGGAGRGGGHRAARGRGVLRLAGAFLAALATATPAQADPLERHRPILRYDRDESDFASSVSAMTSASRLEREDGPARRVPRPDFLGARYGDGRTADPDDRLVGVREPARGRPLVYGRRTADGDGREWLQYWLFFADNPQDRGVLRTGRHAGDWELLQIRLDRDRRPVEVTFAQHTWAQGCRWSEVERRAGAPVVYVTNGSHALYPRPGTYDRPFPDPDDEVDGRGRRVRPPVQRVSERQPRWMGWPGRWGASEASFVPGEKSSPRGPVHQPERWDDPGRFHAAEARPCGAGPPSRAWQTALTVAVALLAVGAAVLAVRRSYNRGR